MPSLRVLLAVPVLGWTIGGCGSDAMIAMDWPDGGASTGSGGGPGSTSSDSVGAGGHSGSASTSGGMQPRNDERFARLDFATDTVPETSLCTQRDERRLGLLAVTLFQRRLDRP